MCYIETIIIRLASFEYLPVACTAAQTSEFRGVKIYFQFSSDRSGSRSYPNPSRVR